MPKPVTFSKEAVLDAAFEIFAREGLHTVSARGIASRMGSSTAPIYSCFSGIDEIRGELIQISLQKLLEYTKKEYTPDLFLNIGAGLLEFVKDYPLIYRAMFLEEDGNAAIFEQFRFRNRVQMRKESTLSLFSDSELDDILSQLTVYTHGLAALICANMLMDKSTRNLIAQLEHAGSAIIGFAAFRAGKMNILEEYQRLQKGCPK